MMSTDDLAKAIALDELYRSICPMGNARSGEAMCQEIRFIVDGLRTGQISARADLAGSLGREGDMRAALRGVIGELEGLRKKVRDVEWHARDMLRDTIKCDCKESHATE